MSDSCQKCLRTIPMQEARWMYTPIPGRPSFRLDKCQGCGPWTPGEKAHVSQRLQQQQAQMQQHLSGAGGCNCTGKR